MENLDDKEIQRLIEEQFRKSKLAVAQESDDDALYRMIFTELEKNPSDYSDSSLAENVILEIEHIQRRDEEVIYGLLITVISLIIFGLTYLAIRTEPNNQLKNILHFLTAHKVIIFFAVINFAIIQTVDKYMLKTKI